MLDKKYSCKTNYITQYVVNYISINAKAIGNALGVSFITIEKTSSIRLVW